MKRGVVFGLLLAIALPAQAEIGTEEVAPGARKPRRLNISGGALIEAQSAYDVQHYDLTLKVLPESRTIQGRVVVKAKVVSSMSTLVLDLDQALKVTGAFEGQKPLKFERMEGRIHVELGSARETGQMIEVAVDYGGEPRVAANPPWDGGFTWKKTKDGLPWIGTSCQGEGADLWWPCKDHPSDEPLGMDLHITVPGGLTAASNGRLVKIDGAGPGWKTHHWRVSTPINNYAVALAIAPYEIIRSTFKSVTGEDVPLVFYALPENAEKARELLSEIKDHLAFFEESFGPYPFRADKYGVAEVPFLGMEHQTLIAYGYGYKKDRFGYDWLHHHELAHEWWGNLVTCPDWNDFWIHEGIGTYCQVLYLEKIRGMEAARKELAGYRFGLGNRRPVAPRESLNSKQAYFGTSGIPDNDIYHKGAWVLHTLRWVIGKEALMMSLRRLCYPTKEAEATTDGSACRFATTEDFKSLAEDISKQDLTWFFEVYLRQPKLPKLLKEREGKLLRLQWEVPGGLPFPMPIPVRIAGEIRRIEMPKGKAEIEISGDEEPEIDPEKWVLRALR